MQFPNSSQISQAVFYVTMSLLASGVILQLLVTPTVTVTEVKFEKQAEIPESEITYLSELSASEQNALKNGEPIDALGKHTWSGGFQPEYQRGYVVSESGVYTIYAEADYGVYQPLAEYYFALSGLGFLILVIQVFLRGVKKENKEGASN